MTNDTDPSRGHKALPRPPARGKADPEAKLPPGDSTGEMEDSNGGLDTGGTATRTVVPSTGLERNGDDPDARTPAKPQSD
jgi:hypothetical protein